MADQRLETGTELAAGHRLGDFEIEAVAGRGAMGVVYRAKQLRAGREVALKVISQTLSGDSSFRSRFEEEALVASSLTHPSIVGVYEAGRADGALYIATQWVEGGDLRTRLAEGGALSPDAVASIARQIGDALDYAHKVVFLHRDIKPANILIADTDTELHAYLADFGVSRPFVRSRGGDDLTESGHIVGTPGYLAPEQIEGGEIDGRADLYELGCTLFEALTGRGPFPRETSFATLLAHTRDPRPLASEVNPGLGVTFDDVFLRALAIDPAERFPTGADLADAVEAAAREAVESASPAALRPPPRTEARRLVIEFDDSPPDRRSDAEDLLETPPSSTAELPPSALRAATRIVSELARLVGDSEIDDGLLDRAVRVVAAERSWREGLGLLLDDDDVARLLGIAVSEVTRLEAEGEIIVLHASDGRPRYPAFQFQDGSTTPLLARAHRTLVTSGGVSPWSAASWAHTSHPELELQSPAQWAGEHRDGGTLLRVAERDAARSAQ